jgi:hypothetical protein
VLSIFEIGSHKLFCQAGSEPWSSWSLPPKYTGLQMWATVPSLVLFFFFMVLGFELRAYTLSHSTALFFFLMGFSRLGLENYLPGLALNCDPPDLCLRSS